MACANCHGPEVGWTGPVAANNIRGGVYRGALPTRFGNRKPPAASCAAFSPVFSFDPTDHEFVGGNFWDGRATGERLNPAAEQALGPFLNPVEQNMPDKAAVWRQVAASKDARLFEQVWGQGSLDCSAGGIDLTYDRFGLSIAAFEASTEVSPFSSTFDDYWTACLAAGNTAEACGEGEGAKETLDPTGILSEIGWAGLIEFGEYCSQCHTSTEAGPAGLPPLFTNNRFDNIGVPRNPRNPFYDMTTEYLDDGTPINPDGASYIDYGLGDFLRTRPEWAHLALENDGKHRVPTLATSTSGGERASRRPTWHNGALKTLEEVVHFYNTRDVPGAGWAGPEVDRNVNRELFEGKPLGNLELADEAERAIVAFLKILTDQSKP